MTTTKINTMNKQIKRKRGVYCSMYKAFRPTERKMHGKNKFYTQCTEYTTTPRNDCVNMLLYMSLSHRYILVEEIIHLLVCVCKYSLAIVTL